MLPRSSRNVDLKVKRIVGVEALQNGKHVFEVEWEHSWEDEEVLKSKHQTLVEEFLSNQDQNKYKSPSSVSTLKAMDISFVEEDNFNNRYRMLHMEQKGRRGINDIASRLQNEKYHEAVKQKINYNDDTFYDLSPIIGTEAPIKFPSERFIEKTSKTKAYNATLTPVTLALDLTFLPNFDMKNVCNSSIDTRNSQKEFGSIVSSLPQQSDSSSIKNLAPTKTITCQKLCVKDVLDRNSNPNTAFELLSRYQPPSTFKCNICSDIFHDHVKFQQHMDMHEQVALLKMDPPKLLKPGTYECKFCQAILDDKDRLKQHLLDDHEREYVHTQPIDQLYQCSLCRKKFVDRENLAKHRIEHQFAQRNSLKPSFRPLHFMNFPKIDREAIIPCQIDKFIQTTCTKNFLSSENRNISAKNETSDAFEILNNSRTLDSNVAITLDSSDVKTAHTTTPTSSQPCDKRKQIDDFSSITMLDFKPVKDVLMVDKIDSGNDVPDKLSFAVKDFPKYRCSLCDQMFETQEKRAQHALLHSNITNSLDCGICGKEFRHRTNLATHMIVHSGVRPHQCSICSRRFTQKVNLQRHMHIHDGSRPFSCGMCSKSFTQKANLQRHILSHTDHSKEKLIKAMNSVPNKSEVNSATNKNLNKTADSMFLNEKTVSPFNCEMCNKSFAQKSNLQKHMMIHSGQRPFQCNVCGKSFRHKAALQKHFTFHTNGSNSFNCQTCQRLFVSKTNLQRHMLTHVQSYSNDCYLCGQKFSTSDNLERHFSEHVSEKSVLDLSEKSSQQTTEVRSLKCLTCDIVFESFTDFSQHLQSHQNKLGVGNDTNISNPRQSNTEEHVVTAMTKLDTRKLRSGQSCSKNNMTAAFSKATVANSVDIQELPTSLKGISVDFKKVLISSSNVKQVCENPSSTFPTLTTQKNFCAICKKKFSSKHEVSQHLKSMHATALDEAQKIKNDQTFASFENYGEKLDNLLLGSNQSSKVIDFNKNIDTPVLCEDEEFQIRENKEFIKDNIHSGSDEYESKGRYEQGNYSCKICNRVLTYKYSLEKHMLLHASSSPYKCSMCSKRFSHKANLDKHIAVHSGVKPYSCHICSRPFSQKSNLQRHQLTHTQYREFICQVCGKRFNHMASLKTHSLIHTGAKPFSCHICQKRFNQKGNLKRHIQTHCTGKKNRLSSRSRELSLKSEYTEQPTKLHLLDAIVKVESLLDRSDKEQMIYQREKRSKLEKSKSDSCFLDQSLPTMIAESIPILDNGNRSNEEHEHLSGYSFENIEENTIITVLPSDQSETDILSVENKKDKEKCKCDLCPKYFTSPFALNSHQQAAHKEIVCDICGKHFSQKANLLKHKLIHANKKPFTCKVCSKAFRQKANLQRHELIHDKERKSVYCEKCGKTFRCNWSLKQHMKSHSQNRPFGCSICGKTFKQRAILKRHFLVHNGLKNFACSICDKSFNHKGNLLRHMTIHDNVTAGDYKEVNLLQSDNCENDIKCDFVS